MFKRNQLITSTIFEDPAELSDSLLGIEKESLRIKDNGISDINIQDKIGPSLCNRYITTDFSESLLEFITPPFKSNNGAFLFLEDIHNYFYKKINMETLWPMSMPLNVKDSSAIQIAEYGKSNLGQFKHLYRRGLANRYGKLMQIISGVHFNYSLSEKLLNNKNFFDSDKQLTELKSDFYFSGLRNIRRNNWLILYLFGASPIIPSGLVQKNTKEMIRLSDDYYYMKEATSLRMSEFGYVNPAQSDIRISHNSTNNYIIDLFNATRTESLEFSKIPQYTDGELNQINKNILQIEDEYYSEARPKSDSTGNIRMIEKIKNNGVNYLEIRSLDLDPFSPSGISEDTINFMELFTIYCLFKESPNISSTEDKEIRTNNHLVSTFGRKNGLKLEKNGQKVALESWAKFIIEDLHHTCEIFDLKSYAYNKSLDEAVMKLELKYKTPSSNLMEQLEAENNLEEFGFKLAEKHRDTFKDATNNSAELLSNETSDSKKRLIQIENDDIESFQEYLKNYSKALN